MKKLIFFSLLLLAGHTLTAQKTIKDVFSSGEVIWYGLDFSYARFNSIYGVEPGSGEDIRDNLIPAWNKLILVEPRKYDMGTTFSKGPVKNNIQPVTEINSKIDASQIIVESSYKFDNPEEVIASAVRRYQGGEYDSGLGLVFVIESFDKPALEASLYIVFFDIASREVLLAERMVGVPVGFGLRNHWAGGIYAVLKQIRKTEYKAWQKKYKTS